MARSLFLFIVCILGVAVNPLALSATDRVAVTRIDESNIVETVPLPEPEPYVDSGANYNYATESNLGIEPNFGADVQLAAYVPVVTNYTVTKYIGTKAEFNATAASLSYSDIYKFGKMIYGHNSWALLGSLAERYAGEIITITEGGVVSNYRVAESVLYAKTSDGRLEGDPGLMSSIVRTAMGHDVALFTCAGTSYGNGDASHRLVVYADRV